MDSVNNVTPNYQDQRLKAGKTFIEYLESGKPIIGDGSYIFTLEMRGYAKAGAWTPESVVESPEAVKQLHIEYLRAGCDVIQVLTFNATDGKLKHTETGKAFTCERVNKEACKLAKEVVGQDKAFICGTISPTPTFNQGRGDRNLVRSEFSKLVDGFSKHNFDFLLGEFFAHVAEAELAIEAMKDLGLPIAITLRMGPTGDHDDVSPGDAAVRLAEAGAAIVGLNCSFDPATCLETMKLMKDGLQKAGLCPFLMIQPAGFRCPDVKHAKDGYHSLPEYPFCVEPRALTRYEARKFARDAWDLGVQYIGGCCGFQSYHIREMAEELAEERGHRPPVTDKYSAFGQTMSLSIFPHQHKSVGRDYWMGLNPGTGRPECSAYPRKDPL